VRICSFSSVDDVAAAIRAIGADKWSVSVMAPKGMHLAILLPDTPLRVALTLKQEALAKGGEVVFPKETMDLKAETVPVLLMGTLRQLCKTCQALDAYPGELKEVGRRLESLLRGGNHSHPAPLELESATFNWGEKTYLMGIINATPDSFSGDGFGGDAAAAVERGKRMVEAGADILDVGGESTRPGSAPTPEAEELARALPVVEGLVGLGVPISIDTRRPAVAKAAIEAGAEIVNDTSALGDEGMLEVVGDTGVAVCLMHMRGTPETMQRDPTYADVVGEVTEFLGRRVAVAVGAGVARDRVLVDPGIGVGKAREHNLDLRNQLDLIRGMCGGPVLVGPSRKTFIGATLDRPVDERVWGTAATLAVAVARGADVVRVHDVEQLADVRTMADAIVRRPRWSVGR